MSEPRSHDQVAEGTRIGDRYRVLRLLGRGGMGSVHLALDEQQNALVAMKIMHARVRTPETLARFRREARVAARIDHPSVVRTLDFGLTGGRTGEGRGREIEQEVPYLVMEYIDGCSLAELLERTKSLNVEITVWIAREVLRGVAVAHAASVVHRDLKPENLLLSIEASGDLAVRIADFGVSRVLEGADGLRADESLLTRVGAVLGTPEYMAPEQQVGEAVDGRADLYAVGVMAFELLTGNRPRTERARATVGGLGASAGIIGRLRAVGVSVDLAAWVARLMAPDRDERFATASAAIGELSIAIDGEPGSSASTITIVPPTRAALRPLRRLIEQVVGDDNRDFNLGNKPRSPAQRRPIVPPISDEHPSTGGHPSLPPPAGALPRSAPRPRWTSLVSQVSWGPILALLVGFVTSAVALSFTSRAYWRGPFPWQGPNESLGYALSESTAGVGWLVLGFLGLRLAPQPMRRWLATLGISQAIYQAFVAVRSVRPEWTQGLVVATVGHGSVMGVLASAIPLGLATAQLQRATVRDVERVLLPFSLAVALLAGTRAWSWTDASGLHAGPMMLAVAPIGTVASFAIGARILQLARKIRDEQKATSLRASGVGIILVGLVTTAHALPYFGIRTVAFSMLALIPIALLAYSLLDLDARLLANPRSLMTALRAIQELFRTGLLVFAGVALTLLAHDAAHATSVSHALFAAPAALFGWVFALRMLSIAEPTISTILSGLAIGSFAALQTSVLADAVLSADHALWLSRVGNAAATPFAWSSLVLMRRQVGRVSEAWIEPATAIGMLVFVPLALSSGYFVDVRRLSWGFFPQAGWAFLVFTAFVSGMISYNVYFTVIAVGRARGSERAARIRTALALLALGFCAFSLAPNTLGWNVPLLCNLAFLPIAFAGYEIWNMEVRTEPFFRSNQAGRGAIDALVTALTTAVVLVAARALDAVPLASRIAVVLLVVMVVVNPVRRLIENVTAGWLDDPALDLQRLQADLHRILDRGMDAPELGRHLTRILRAAIVVDDVSVYVRGSTGDFYRGSAVLPANIVVIARLLRDPNGVMTANPGEVDTSEMGRGYARMPIVVGARVRGALPIVAFIFPRSDGQFRSEAAIRALSSAGSMIAVAADYVRVVRRRARERAAMAKADAPSVGTPHASAQNDRNAG